MPNFEKSPEFKSEKGLDKVLSEMEKIIAEWRKPIPDEGVRNQELPLVKKLSEMEIPDDKKEEVLRIIQDFEGVADDKWVRPILDEIKKKLAAE